MNQKRFYILQYAIIRCFRFTVLLSIKGSFFFILIFSLWRFSECLYEYILTMFCRYWNLLLLHSFYRIRVIVNYIVLLFIVYLFQNLCQNSFSKFLERILNRGKRVKTPNGCRLKIYIFI